MGDCFPHANSQDNYFQHQFSLQMSRQMSPEREKEYRELYSYLDFYMTSVKGIASDDHLNLASVSAGIIEKYGK